MDIKAILDEYKEALQEQEAAAQQRDLESHQEEQTRRRLNAKKVEGHLSEVVRPVLEAAQKDILEAGFLCEVEFATTRDPQVPDYEQTFTLCLKMTTARDDMSQSAWLKYAGESDVAALRVTECYGDSTVPQDRGMSPLRAYDRSAVERQVEDFTRVVFRLSK